MDEASEDQGGDDVTMTERGSSSCPHFKASNAAVQSRRALLSLSGVSVAYSTTPTASTNVDRSVV